MFVHRLTAFNRLIFYGHGGFMWEERLNMIMGIISKCSGKTKCKRPTVLRFRGCLYPKKHCDSEWKWRKRMKKSVNGKGGDEYGSVDRKCKLLIKEIEVLERINGLQNVRTVTLKEEFLKCISNE